MVNQRKNRNGKHNLKIIPNSAFYERDIQNQNGRLTIKKMKKVYSANANKMKASGVYVANRIVCTKP